ncbi:hypothetical protein MM300_11045 [Evansella sp. LMS18]|uniref:hypothetical protein n=1 Tax=Evansella sp. LMS18 TaxID=2924033 RepID=UPI0020D18AD7|nr:hypothetical protein [Evansella sp. LMS18]UTR12769.1 hypothetical protein MM300_11045 [Evansella sp. LMS18]
MKINLIIFVTSIKEEDNIGTLMMKTVESDFRPVQGDILDDPGFHPGFHNGYEVVKVTINYASGECFVSLQPLVIDREEIKAETYIDRLKANGWHAVAKDELMAD